MIALIDNFDSFTYNLYQQLRRLLRSEEQVLVVRNNEITAAALLELQPRALVFSPGPGGPDDTGICAELLRRFISIRRPVLGVCLGHQLIAQHFGGVVKRAPSACHGKQSELTHNGKNLFLGLPSGVKVARYHSLSVYEPPSDLSVDAYSDERVIMALTHKELPIWGVQFHPESFLTPDGDKIVSNFLSYAV